MSELLLFLSLASYSLIGKLNQATVDLTVWPEHVHTCRRTARPAKSGWRVSMRASARFTSGTSKSWRAQRYDQDGIFLRICQSIRYKVAQCMEHVRHGMAWGRSRMLCMLGLLNAHLLEDESVYRIPITVTTEQVQCAQLQRASGRQQMGR